MAVLAVLAGCAVVGGLYAHIVHFGRASDDGRADVIIVLGAAVCRHGPSPALQARVWRAAVLYHEERAPYMIMTGGLGQYPPAEAEAMAALARSWDVDENRIRLESISVNTRENLQFAVEIMRENNWRRAIIVTDDFHMKRAVTWASKMGIEPLRAPVTPKMAYYSTWQRTRYTLRECAAFVHQLLTMPFLDSSH